MVATVDWSHWPLVTIEAAMLEPAAARTAVLDALAAALARDDAFVVVVTVPAGRTRPRAGEALGVVRRLRAIRPDMRRRCGGLALVVDATEQPRPASDRFWGCPTLTVADRESARRWAAGRLAGVSRQG